MQLLQARLDADNQRYTFVSNRRQALLQEQERLKGIYRNYHSSADWSSSDQSFVKRALGKIWFFRQQI